MSAVFSPDRVYRYTLTRAGLRAQRQAVLTGPNGLGTEASLRALSPRTLLFVCLNPSTADETQDDPTVRRCKGYARDWGFETLVVCNLFALRSTNPGLLYRHDDPVGPENDQHILAQSRKADMIVLAWGNHGRVGNHSDVVRDLIYESVPDRSRVFTLGMTSMGEPKHPLYLPKNLQPVQLWP